MSVMFLHNSIQGLQLFTDPQEELNEYLIDLSIGMQVSEREGRL